MKVVFMGDPNVGKTAIRERYLGRGFQSKYMMTHGADFALKETVVDDRAIKFQIWDLAGQQRFNAVRSVYYLGVLGGILIFDVTNKESFLNCSSWVKELWTNNEKGTIPLVILGNNSDQREQFPDCISIETAERYAEKLSEQTKKRGFEVKYYDTEPKTGKNIKNAFDYLGKCYYQYLEKQRAKEKPSSSITNKEWKEKLLKLKSVRIKSKNEEKRKTKEKPLSPPPPPPPPPTKTDHKVSIEAEKETLLEPNEDPYQAFIDKLKKFNVTKNEKDLKFDHR